MLSFMDIVSWATSTQKRFLLGGAERATGPEASSTDLRLVNISSRN